MRRRKFNGIISDLPDMKSPVTGEILHGRAGLREHMKRHNLAHTEDFKGEWAEAAKNRNVESRPDPERAREIAHAMEHTRKGERR